jgi:carbamoyltransferase
MTVVIGFNWPVMHDHAVGVIVDGEFVFASEEERWTRHKHSPVEPPINALKQAFVYLRRKYGIRPKDVDAYAVNFDPRLYPIDHRRRWLIGSIRYLSGKLSMGLLEGGFITAGLRFGLLFLLGDYLDIARRFVRSVIHSVGEDAPEGTKNHSCSSSPCPCRLRLLLQWFQ